ncbi:17352_t:CDS:2 [Dentiscutata heterogama]|uniref:17352_t:CDS:1 n=1 Tax=Dentiscutata heterogama TaxID=1316150 RepID=A0ACA9L1T4_9GLOM|nr:17352_t:CDS:2 [Dentiscutata heterogama]
MPINNNDPDNNYFFDDNGLPNDDYFSGDNDFPDDYFSDNNYFSDYEGRHINMSMLLIWWCPFH